MVVPNGLLTALALAVASGGCSDFGPFGAAEPPLAEIRVVAGMSMPGVAFGKAISERAASAWLPGRTVDSLYFTGVKLIFVEIKLRSRQLGSNSKVAALKSLLIVDESGERVVVNESIRPGTYDTVSFKLRSLEDRETTRSPDRDYADFMTPERHTLIVEGVAWRSGTPLAFRYGARVEGEFRFDLKQMKITLDGPNLIVIQVDPAAAFKDSESRQVMDPLDPENASRIDEGIKATLTAFHAPVN